MNPPPATPNTWLYKTDAPELSSRGGRQRRSLWRAQSQGIAHIPGSDASRLRNAMALPSRQDPGASPVVDTACPSSHTEAYTAAWIQ
jgi:hypothetical protein